MSEPVESCVFCNRELLPGVRAYATNIGDMLKEGGFCSDMEVPWEDLRCTDCQDSIEELIAAINVAAYRKGKPFAEVVDEVKKFLDGGAALEVSAVDRMVRVEVLLKETVDKGHAPMEATVEINLSGINIVVPSVETRGATPGYGSPVWIEQDNGQLVCRLYDDTDESSVVTKRWEKKFTQRVVLHYMGVLGVKPMHWVHACDIDTSKIIGMDCAASKEEAMSKAQERCEKAGWIIVSVGEISNFSVPVDKR